MKIKKYSFTIIVGFFFIICGIIFVNFNKRLSEQQILELREQYPICGARNNELFLTSTATSSLEEKVENGNIFSFVYGEVLGDYKVYYRNISTGEEVLDTKLQNYGLSTFEFYEYSISVIEDVTGQYQKGDIIKITGNMMFIDEKPDLSGGMKIVVPLVKYDEKNDRNFYSVIGMYYVTEDGYALSCYDETINLARSSLSGVKVNQLLNKLSDMIIEKN